MELTTTTRPDIPLRKHFRSTSSSSAKWRNSLHIESKDNTAPAMPVKSILTSVDIDFDPGSGMGTGMDSDTKPRIDSTSTASRSMTGGSVQRQPGRPLPPSPNRAKPFVNHTTSPGPIRAAKNQHRDFDPAQSPIKVTTSTLTSISNYSTTPYTPPPSNTRRPSHQHQYQHSIDLPPLDTFADSTDLPDRRTKTAPAHATTSSVGSIKDSIATALRSWSRPDHDRKKSINNNSNVPSPPPHGVRHSRISSLSRRLSISGPSLSSPFSSNAVQPPASAHPPAALNVSPKKSNKSHRNSKSLTSLPFFRSPSPPPPQPTFDAQATRVGPAVNSASLPLHTHGSPHTATRINETSPSPQRRRHSRRISESHSLRKLAKAKDSVENLHKRKSSIVAIAVEASPVVKEPLPATHLEQPVVRRRTSSKREEGPAGRSARQMEGDEDAAVRRRRQEKEKKSMLSRALQQAHAAVILDNEQSFEGAIDAYADACELLQQVLVRSSAEEDRAKLDAIRSTYENRISELRQMNPELGASRRLLSTEIAPDRSISAQTVTQPAQDIGRLGYSATVSGPVVSKTVGVSDPPPSYPQQNQNTGRTPEDDSRPATNEPYASSDRAMPQSHTEEQLSGRNQSQHQTKDHQSNTDMNVPSEGHAREDSGGAMSWLDTIEESGASSVASSVHSASGDGLHRRQLRIVSGGTEAEFNAAMDAAVEAAYGEGLEPEPYDDARRASLQIKSAMANVHLAKERVREAEREDAILAAHSQSQQMKANAAYGHGRYSLDDEGEEEERMLEEMTKEFMGEDYNFGLNDKSGTVPRQSDSSDFSGSSVWHSSMSSSRNTAGTTLSTIADDMTGKSNGLPRLDEEARVSQDLNRSPQRGNIREQSSNRPTAEDIRSRRLSGQPGQAKQLKIDTQPGATSSKALSQAGRLPTQSGRTETHSLVPKSAYSDQPSLPSANPRSADSLHPASYFGMNSTSPHPAVSPGGDSTMTISPVTPATLERSLTNGSSTTAQYPAPRVLSRKQKSNVSLNGSRSRNFSASSPDESEPSTTPLSQHFYGTGANGSSYGLSSRGADQVPALPAFPPDLVAMMHADNTANANLLISDMHGPVALGNTTAATINAPTALEPCPESYLLRPFWLMRAVFQTLVHPRGGYISNKLFVPRDVWRVKGVKLRSVDDKIAACDLLITALGRLGNVDTLDADAVLEEMQNLESTLEQAQLTLTKKLGAEVGVNGVQSLFKDAARGSSATDSSAASFASSLPESHTSLPATRTVSQGKSYLSSWRKLRSKSSAVGLSSSTNSHSSMTGAGSLTSGVDSIMSATQAAYKKDSLTMSTLPMTSLTQVRFAKRDLSALEFDNEGPHAAYVLSLARLFDAVQVIDQIARQVEDPGLKFSSSTHVGLELCTRHAAEFFGFYICRFVLSDLGILLDKFIKRGSEWVLV